MSGSVRAVFEIDPVIHRPIRHAAHGGCRLLAPAQRSRRGPAEIVSCFVRSFDNET